MRKGSHMTEEQLARHTGPLNPAWKGGKHNANNVVPACAHCNGSKGNKTLEEWWAKKQREAVSV
jgi:5-methylcytosine-specific restriction endonuclease McrA